MNSSTALRITCAFLKQKISVKSNYQAMLCVQQYSVKTLYSQIRLFLNGQLNLTIVQDFQPSAVGIAKPTLNLFL